MGTHYKGSSSEINALNSYIKLTRAADSISNRLKNLLLKQGLTDGQFGILEALHHLGPLCQKDLAKKLLKSGGNMTMVIDNLEKQNLVVRKRGERDRRFFTVHLTEKGRNLIGKIFPEQLSAIVDAMNSLTEEEHIELQRMCKKIGLQLIRQEA